MPDLLRSEMLNTAWLRLGIDAQMITARGLMVYEEAQLDTLEIVANADDGREWKLIAPAASAWRAMQARAREDGISLIVLSAFRNVQRQIELIEKKLKSGMTIESILQSVAPPGCSEHHTGRAIDIGSDDHPTIEETFAQTRAFGWLTQHARDFGFVMSYPKDNAMGYVYEPWHWCWHEKIAVADA
jgi:zinc D-Ala-D-Ala carboxypeptidase